jgi:hypothetical protein
MSDKPNPKQPPTPPPPPAPRPFQAPPLEHDKRGDGSRPEEERRG